MRDSFATATSTKMNSNAAIAISDTQTSLHMPANHGGASVVPENPELRPSMTDPEINRVNKPTVAARHLVAPPDRLNPLAGPWFFVSGHCLGCAH
jgi:hypothetical protein